MKPSDFKTFKEKINTELENMHNTFLLRGDHYVFHEKLMPEYDSSNHGISLIFSSDELRVDKFLLLDLITEKGRTRYTNSKTISSGFYRLTYKQKLDLIKLIDLKSGAIEV